MFKDIIKQEAGIEIYPLISLTFFVIFFIALFIVTISYRTSFIHQASMLPLDEADASLQSPDTNQK